jgi:hypothetical protein
MADDGAEKIGNGLKRIFGCVRRNGLARFDLALLCLKDKAVFFVKIDATCAFGAKHGL